MELLKEHETNNRSKGCKVLPKQLFFPTYASEHDEDSVHTYSYNYKYEEKHVMMQLVTVVSLPCSLVFHEVWTLLEKLSCLPKNWPTHCARRQTFLPVPYFIPPQESRAKTEHQHYTYNCHEHSH